MVAVPFRISIPQDALNDLQRRLAQTRWPDEIEDSAWKQGTNLTYLRNLTQYWMKSFDWKAQEAVLNNFSHFHATIDGVKVHFIHERGKGPNPKPLILTHGWPSTFFEMSKIIPMLTDPDRFGGDPRDSFDVIVPSLPGFGFSDSPRKRGFSSWQTAELWMKLMTETLGYADFFAHGGDIGSGVTTRLGFLYPNCVTAIHLLAVVDPILPSDSHLTESEKRYLENRKTWWEQEGAYWHQQQTRPQTLAYGLNDSPVGLASWIIEKYRAWSDCGGDLESRFTKDELLTNITLYWMTQTIGSSIRLYYENWGPDARLLKESEKIRVPTAIALTREEIELVPREWADRAYNVQHWTEFPRGGHFMALEEPKLLVEDIRAAFRALR